jgi:hypothetical protein
MGNDGLFQRFQLLVYPDATEWQYTDDKPNTYLREQVLNIFKQMDEMTIEELVRIGAREGNESNPRPYFRFSEKAQKVWVDWQIDLNTNVIPNEEHPIIVQHLQKYPKLMASLALFFHLLDGMRFDSVDCISEDSALMAVEWCKYLESHMRRIYGLVLNAAVAKASALGTRLKKLPDTDDWVLNGFRARDVTRKNWKSLTDSYAVETALEILIDNQWLKVKEVATSCKGGRPTKHYFINPKL